MPLTFTGLALKSLRQEGNRLAQATSPLPLEPEEGANVILRRPLLPHRLRAPIGTEHSWLWGLLQARWPDATHLPEGSTLLPLAIFGIVFLLLGYSLQLYFFSLEVRATVVGKGFL